MVNAPNRFETRFPPFKTVVGVDFSGAAQAGKTAWCAELSCTRRLKPGHTTPKFRLDSLNRLGKLAGSDDRDQVLAYLVDRISSQEQTFWSCDFPFGLPIELGLGRWKQQLAYLNQFDGTAKELGRALVRRTQQRVGALHVRRRTDRETQTPFDCYHYRIIYQTFHGMRDVLLPLADHPHVCVLPFQYGRLDPDSTLAVMVEACPASTLKRWGLPHQRYKQSGGRPPEPIHRSQRRKILSGLRPLVDISEHRRRVLMNDPGGDALDAVLAAVGGWQGFARADHGAVATDDRYPIEGRVFC
ncbi:DUF429 domain-containing protein [Roseiconus nitratireducens]|uniref:DUF429 domain-containing protein n=1 Tax=Roseiconus nitratireducens TaxID=2605748 RepID=A0A5M6DAU2_9BACT|nr:DUF429 domain-containing protein [Roseiconus nitratireducens]